MTKGGGRHLLIIAANTAWNLTHFRAGLIRALLQEGYELVATAPPSPSAERQLAELGIRFAATAVDRSGLNPFRDLRQLSQYVKLLRRTSASAFLSFTSKPNIYGCLAARFAGIPAIPNISGLGTAFINNGLLSRLVGGLYRLAFAKAPIVFFQNPDDRDEFIAYKIVTKAQARLLPGSGVNLERFKLVPLPSGPVRFLLIARLLGDKGLREYVQAARVLKPKYPGVSFQLIGPLDPKNRTGVTAEELAGWQSEGMIHYLGEAADVAPFIASATVVVLPSYREGLPRTLLEGAAMGRPLIASDVPGCRQVVEHEKNGFLCAAADEASLANAMERMIGMPTDDLRAMGLEGRRIVEQGFGEEKVIQRYLAALSELLPLPLLPAGL